MPQNGQYIHKGFLHVHKQPMILRLVSNGPESGHITDAFNLFCVTPGLRQQHRLRESQTTHGMTRLCQSISGISLPMHTTQLLIDLPS